MPLHLIKLCVGCDSIADLEHWIRQRMKQKQAKGERARHVHTTRMTPKRVDELLDGGSLYWVIRGEVQCRQRLIGIEPFRDKDGIGRCRLVLEPKVTAVEPRAWRAFQGWRYLSDREAPRDVQRRRGTAAHLPEGMRRELRSLGLL